MNDQALSALIQSHIRSRRLPHASARHTLFGGKGEGVPCDCCGRLITVAQIQFEVAFAGGVVIQMHLVCHDEWVKASDAHTIAPPSVMRDRTERLSS